MVRRVTNEFAELEGAALKAEVFMDYEAVAPTNGAFAVKCVISDKKGGRICRLAADKDISVAQEHAGYMALCAYFHKEVNEGLYKEMGNQPHMPNAANTGNHAPAHATSNTGNRPAMPTNPSQSQNMNNRTAPAANSQQGKTPQNGASRADNQRQQPQPPQPQTNPAQGNTSGNMQQNMQQNRPPQSNRPGGQMGTAPATSGSRSMQGTASAQPNQNRPQPQNNQGAANRANSSAGMRQTGSMAQQPPRNQQPVQSAPQTTPQPNPQTAADNQQMPNPGMKPEDIRIPIAVYKLREKNRISDLLKEESGRMILSSIYVQPQLKADVQSLKEAVCAYMDYYKIPIKNENFIKNGFGQ